MSFTLTASQLSHVQNDWTFRDKWTHGNHQFMRYENYTISGLAKSSMVRISPPMSAGYIIGKNTEIRLNTTYKDWSYYRNNKVDSLFITAQGYTQIRAWIDSLVPEPEPEPVPEPEPDIIDDGNGIIDGFKDTMKSWIQQAILAGLAFLEGPLNLIRSLIASLGQTISGIVGAVKAAIDTVMAKVVGMFEIVVDKIKGVIDKVWDSIEKVWLTLKDMFKSVKTAIVTAFKTSWKFIKETFTELWGKMKDGLKFIGESIVKGLKYLWDKIKDALDWVWKILNKAYVAIKDTVNAVWDRTKEKLTETIESIKESFGDAIDRMQAFLEVTEAEKAANTLIAESWTEDRIVTFMEFILGAQKKVLAKLAKQGVSI